MKKRLFSPMNPVFWILFFLLPTFVSAQGLSNNVLSGEIIELQGQITDFSFRAPVTSISLLVSDRSGINTWTIQAPSASQLRRLGWGNSSLFTGEIVKLRARAITGLPHHAELVSVVRANGALMLAGAQQDAGHLDLTAIPSGLYRLDSDHAYMTFSYNNRGYSRPQLRFDRFSASLSFDGENPEKSDVRVEVDVSSLNSGVDALDQELRSRNFFDSLNHPRISFRSRQIEMDAWGHAKVTGDIEIKGRKRSITLDAQLNNAGMNPISNMHTLGVSITGTINRSDWGMNQFAPSVSDEVQIQIEAEFVQPLAR